MGMPGCRFSFFLVALHLPIMMVISTFLMEHAVRADGVEESPMNFLAIGKTLLRNLLLNPIIIGILVGIIWRVSGLA